MVGENALGLRVPTFSPSLCNSSTSIPSAASSYSLSTPSLSFTVVMRSCFSGLKTQREPYLTRNDVARHNVAENVVLHGNIQVLRGPTMSTTEQERGGTTNTHSLKTGREEEEVVVGRRRARKSHPTRATAKPGALAIPSQSRGFCHTLRNFSATRLSHSQPPLEQVITRS